MEYESERSYKYNKLRGRDAPVCVWFNCNLAASMATICSMLLTSVLALLLFSRISSKEAQLDSIMESTRRTAASADRITAQFEQNLPLLLTIIHKANSSAIADRIHHIIEDIRNTEDPRLGQLLDFIAELYADELASGQAPPAPPPG